MSNYEIPVYTTSPNKNCESLGILSHYHATMYTKELFGKISNDELIQELIKILVKKAAEINADAIYGLRIDYIPASGMMGAGWNYNLYGTAVKIL